MAGWLMLGGVAALAEDDDPFACPEAGAAVEPEEGSAFAPDDTVQEETQDADPFATPGYGWGSGIVRIPAARLAEKRDTLSVRVEVWEVETRVFALAMDGFDGPDAVANWRKAQLENRDARLVHAPMVAVDAKSRGSVEAVVEQIYPTEYEPPEMLPDKAVEQLLSKRVPESLSEVIEQLTSGATPTSFETRNTGVTLEAAVQPVAGKQDCWDLSLAFEEVVLAGYESFEPEGLHVKMPTFATFRCGGLLRVAEERWQLVSALAPPQGIGKEGTIWVTLVRVDPVR